MAMNIGDLVSQYWHGTVRLGTVTAKEIHECGWAYYAVIWHDDSNWIRAAREDTSGVIRKKKWYRVDEISPVQAYHLERSVYEHRMHRRGNSGSTGKEVPVC